MSFVLSVYDSLSYENGIVMSRYNIQRQNITLQMSEYGLIMSVSASLDIFFANYEDSGMVNLILICVLYYCCHQH